MRSRFALFLLTLPVACYAYACSSDDPAEVAGGDGGVVEDDAGETPTEDAAPNPKPDAAEPAQDAGPQEDGGDGGAPVFACFGNPLLDGGADGGNVLLDAATAVPVATLNGGFADGPQWIDALGGIVLSDFYQARILGLNDAGTSTLRQVSTVPGAGNPATSPVGNAFFGGVIFTTANQRDTGGASAILRMFPDGGVLPSWGIGQAVSPNDLVIAQDGTVYFTDPRFFETLPPTTGVYRIQADGGSPTRFATYSNGERPNGVALNADGSRLYVSFTDPPRIDYFPITNGAIGVAVNAIATASLGDAPDGIAVDKAGNLYVAEADANDNDRGRVEVFSPSGQKWGAIIFPTKRPTGVAFGGSDDKSLYVTTEDATNGNVFVFKSACAGLR